MKLMKTGATSAMVLSLLVGGATTTLAAGTEGGAVNSKGTVSFEPSKTPTDPVDPTDPTDPIDPTEPVEPGTDGPLSLDFAPNLNFDMNEISTKDETYNAKLVEVKDGENTREVPNFVQVTDKRGTNAGWTLEVKQNGQFKNDATLNKELIGAQISLTKTYATSTSVAEKPTVNTQIDLDPTGASLKVMSAAKDAGAGTWLASFGKDNTEAEKAITLSVPGKTVKDAVAYDTTLTWTLTDTPDNGTVAPKL